DDAHFRTVKVTVFAYPCIFDEIPHIDDEHISLPFADRIPVVRWVRICAMRPSIRGNDAVGITGNVFIKEDGLLRQLNDFSWWTDSWHAGLAAVEHRVKFAFVIKKLLHSSLIRRLVRGFRRRRQRAMDRSRVAMARALVD